MTFCKFFFFLNIFCNLLHLPKVIVVPWLELLLAVFRNFLGVRTSSFFYVVDATSHFSM